MLTICVILILLRFSQPDLSVNIGDDVTRDNVNIGDDVARDGGSRRRTNLNRQVMRRIGETSDPGEI